jgi:hypothetical protein
VLLLFKIYQIKIMKSEGFSFFAGLFSPKSSEEKAGTSSDVYITSSSQPYVLREKMKEAKLTHGETVMADITPVRLEATHGKMAMYFCPVKTIAVSETIAPGDGGVIPTDATVYGLTVPPEFKSGLYTLKNVELTSNGVMQVKATAKTTWELVPIV